MALFNEEILTVQDEYVRVDPSREDENNDDDLEYSNDDLGENTEVTPLGDAMEEDNIDDFYKVDPDDEDDLENEDDLDVETVEIDEDDDIENFSSQITPDEDDDLLDDDDDLLSDDDDLDTPVLAPELDDEDLDDDDLLSVDDDEDDLDDEVTPSSSIDTTTDFSSRDHGRVTGTMIDHEPGLGGSDKRDYNL